MGYTTQMLSDVAGVAVTDGTTVLWSGACLVKAGTELYLRYPTRSGATVDKVGVFISQNDVGSAATFRIRKDSANSTISITVTANTTGLFENTATSETFLTTNAISCSMSVPAVAGTHTVTATIAFYRLLSTSNTYHYWVASDSGQGYATTTTNYCSLGEVVRWGGTTELRVAQKLYTDGTLKNGFAALSANTRDSNSNLRSRIDTGGGSADGNINVVITASTSGLFEDTANTDTVSSGYFVNMALTGTAGTGTNTFGTYGMGLETTNKKAHHTEAYALTGATTANTTWYWPIGSSWSTNTTLARAQARVTYPSTASNLQIRLSANTMSTNGSFTLWVNSGASALTTTITAGVTGLYEDATHSVTIASGDLLAHEAITSPVGTGTMTPNSYSMMLEDTTPEVSTRRLAALGVG